MVFGLGDVNRSLKRTLEDTVKEVTRETYKAARNSTPVRTGNAKSKWQQRPRQGIVENRVPYIERLEAGASKQAPKGIIGPTLTQVKRKFR